MKREEIAKVIKEAAKERKENLILFGIMNYEPNKVILEFDYSRSFLSITRAGYRATNFNDLMNHISNYYNYEDLFFTEEEAENFLKEKQEEKFNQAIDKFFK